MAPQMLDEIYENGQIGQYEIIQKPIFSRRKLRVVCIGAGASGMVRYKLTFVVKLILLIAAVPDYSSRATRERH